MTNKTYDILKYIAQIVLPALATLYLALAGFWGLPYPEAIAGTIVAIDTFLGALLKVSTDNYNKQNDKEVTDAQDTQSAEDARKEE